MAPAGQPVRRDAPRKGIGADRQLEEDQGKQEWPEPMGGEGLREVAVGRGNETTREPAPRAVHVEQCTGEAGDGQRVAVEKGQNQAPLGGQMEHRRQQHDSRRGEEHVAVKGRADGVSRTRGSIFGDAGCGRWW